MTKVNKAVLRAWILIPSQWSRVKSNDHVLKGQSYVSEDGHTPTENKAKLLDPVTLSLFLCKVQKETQWSAK